MRIFWRHAGLAISCALLTGCASAVPIALPRAHSNSSCTAPAPDGDLLLGVALSGGGSRAAIFGTAGLEALGRLRVPEGDSVLGKIGYLSSVSGGSLAASYYAKHKPRREIPILTPAGSYSGEYETFFRQFRERVAQNFQGPLIRRQISSFRWLNSALTARSLEEVLKQRLVGDLLLRDLSQRQLRGDIPGLLFNAALFNSGRRFIFSTMPSDVARYDIFADLRESAAMQRQSAAMQEDAVEFIPLSQRMWEGLTPLTPHDLRVDPCSMSVASIVAASASFPPWVGPITFHVKEEETYSHIGDGGLYENSGLETLFSVFLKKLQEKRTRRALIFAFDSSYPFTVGERLLDRRSQPFSLLSYDFTRIPGIMEQRAYAYNHLFFRMLRILGVIPDANTFRIIYLHHTDAKWRGDLADLPKACRDDRRPLKTPTEVTDRLAEIPTRLRIVSACDRQLLVTAADKVVAQSRQEIEDFLAGRPSPERTAQ